MRIVVLLKISFNRIIKLTKISFPGYKSISWSVSNNSSNLILYRSFNLLSFFKLELYNSFPSSRSFTYFFRVFEYCFFNLSLRDRARLISLTWIYLTYYYFAFSFQSRFSHSYFFIFCLFNSYLSRFSLSRSFLSHSCANCIASSLEYTSFKDKGNNFSKNVE